MPPQVEILVHISAPSRGSDDARYRREARGLQEWHTASRIDIVRSENQDEGQEDGGQEALDLPRPTKNAPQNSTPVAKSFQSSDLAFSSFHTSFSVSPEPPKSKAIGGNAFTTPVVAIPPPRPPIAFKPDRTPAGRPQVQVERTPYPPIAEIQQLHKGRIQARPQATTSNKTPLRRSHSDSSTWRTPPSVIPDSQPASPSAQSLRSSSGAQTIPELFSPRLTFKRPEKNPLVSAPSTGNAPTSSSEIHDPAPSSPSKNDSNPEEQSQAGSASPILTQKRLPPPSSPTRATKRLRRSSSPSSHRHENNALQQAKQPAAPQATPEPRPPAFTPPFKTSANTSDPANEIHPPRPLPSRSTTHPSHSTLNSQATNPTSNPHLTPSLATLSQHLPLDRSFRPSRHTRTLDPWERGHWVVPLHCLPPGKADELWQFLREMIGRGEIGWGCWCARESTTGTDGQDECGSVNEHGAGTEDRATAAGQQDAGRKKIPHDGGSESGASVVTTEPGSLLKMYTWASIVPETWLLLYVGSRRAVKGLGRAVRWVDAAGETVVEM